MKARMLNKMWLLAGLLVSMTLATACSATGGAKQEASATGIVSKPGFYQDKNVGVTLTYPAAIMSIPDKLQADEVLRMKSDKGVPVITLTVRDKSKNSGSLEEAPQTFKKLFEARLKGAGPFKLAEGKVMTLKNGVQAAYARVDWKIGKEAYKLVTVSLTIYKGDKVIIVTCTAPKDMPPVEVLDSWVQAIKVDV